VRGEPLGKPAGPEGAMFTLYAVACLHTLHRSRSDILKRKRHIKSAAAGRHALTVGLWAVLIALPVGFLSQTLIKEIPSPFISGVILLLVISVGIIFDVIGVAVTAAKEGPLHARAANRIFGARQAAGLVQNAHEVASFCNDVVGDVSGTLSGTLAIVLVYQFFNALTPVQAILSTTMMSAVVAGLIVGGKAYGKVFAIRRSTDIIFQVGRIVAAKDGLLRWLREIRREAQPPER
jgi:hypothetical protein